MQKILRRSNLISWGTSFVAIAFGIMTIKSGGFALFGGQAGKAFAGNYVPFVLWFNFIAGFFYVITGIGLLFKQPWAIKLALMITLLTVIIFIALGIYIMSGGLYESRTIGAMGLRLFVWFFIYILSAYLMFENKEF